MPYSEYGTPKITKGIKIGKVYFLLLSTGKIQNFTGLVHVSYTNFSSLSQITIKLTHVFMVAGWWVAADFDSQLKIENS